MTTDTTPLRVMSLHALAYCERLFYLEEVEEIRVADDRVFAGRRLHLDLEPEDEGDWTTLEIESDALGIRGKVDCLKRRDGHLIPYEHKRGRSQSTPDGPAAWESDWLQAVAYGALVQEATGTPIPEVRVRYHADHKTVRVPLDDGAHAALLAAIERARHLQTTTDRPPITEHSRRCTHCSLAPVCLPEEERLVDRPEHPTLRLFPPHMERQSVHVTEPGARVGRAGHALKITRTDGTSERLPIERVDQIVIHGHAQITTQALALCQYRHVGVHWLTGGGAYLGGLTPGAGQVQRRHRQFAALADPHRALTLAIRLVEAKVQHQLGFLLRSTRGQDRPQIIEDSVDGIRSALERLPDVLSLDTLRGHEGNAARHYFAAFGALTQERFEPPFHLDGRTRRPPRDRVNALLSFGYSLLYRDCVAACLTAGLEPSFGFFHQPRSAAMPLALDLQELLRVALVDIPVLGSLGRGQWEPDADFVLGGGQVWLSDSGRKKAIALFERRKEDTWRHPVLNYSLSYGRMIELEARLLEKEWTGSPGLFARVRLR